MNKFKEAYTHFFEGEAKVTLRFVHAVLQNGTPAPQYDADCLQRLSHFGSRYVGLSVNSKYKINTKTLIMSASSEFIHPAFSRFVSVTLWPMGISDIYGFIGNIAPDITIFFFLDKNLKNPVSTFLIPNKGLEYNCVISSSPKYHNRIRTWSGHVLNS
ncbi:hypothetical protein [Xenorhabdus innexi]|uniref:Putative exported protein n=1 Tax=Xenorhabdus innexi TaxID=290109 RepID=A0A1N6MWF4_9GAMM